MDFEHGVEASLEAEELRVMNAQLRLLVGELLVKNEKLREVERVRVDREIEMRSAQGEGSVARGA